jgi:hypothetical protein
MPKRSSKDLNEAAFAVVQQVTQQAAAEPAKNPAAVALGRLGGIKGGKARAKKLSPLRRSRIARQAALIRWKKSVPKDTKK